MNKSYEIAYFVVRLLILLLSFFEQLKSINKLVGMIILFCFVKKGFVWGLISESVAFGSIMDGGKEGFLVDELLLGFTHIILFIAKVIIGNSLKKKIKLFFSKN